MPWLWLAFLTLLPLHTFAADTELVTETSSGLTVTNTSDATLVNLRVGKTEIARLDAGQATEIKAKGDRKVFGRFSVDTWPRALGNLLEMGRLPLENGGSLPRCRVAR